MPPRRRQRKRKVIEVKDPETFFADLEDIFEDCESPADIFAELAQDNSFKQNHNDYLELFCERCFSGRYGLIYGEKVDGSPLQTSFLGCQDDELDNFIVEFGKLCQSFLTIRNKMDLILAKFLSNASHLDGKLKDRAFLIAALIIKYKVYNRSEQSDFYITGLLALSNGQQIIGDTLNALAGEIGEPETFAFCRQHQFIAQMEKYEKDEIFEKCPWFNELYNNYQNDLREQEIKDRFVALLESQDAEDFSEEYATIKEESGAEWKQILTYAMFKTLETVPKTNLGFEIEQIFDKIVEDIRQIVTDVRGEGLLMDCLQANCYKVACLNIAFRPLVLYFYKQRIIDGRVIIAWYERAQGDGKMSFQTQISQFYEWLKN